MIQIILLVMGIIALVRLPGFGRLTVDDFPGVDPDAFVHWRKAQRAAAIWLVAIAWGLLVLQVFVGLIMGLVLVANRANKDEFQRAMLLMQVISVVTVVLSVIPIIIPINKARRLREQAGIQWPRKKPRSEKASSH
ncbi:MAG TPA: hypothetical protein VG797_03170 [Phycisphaerales bacterium]|nr:hypothetical protein [Phycisphaerales bacterium]